MLLTPITPIDIIVTILIGIPFGILFPVRPKYIILDLAAAIVFFPSVTLVRIAEGTFTGQILEAGIMYCVFLLSAYISTRFNKTAQAKEEIVKVLEHHNKE